jgi:hypothetical protein
MGKGCMDSSAIINALRVGVQRIEAAIAELESLNSPNGSRAALRDQLSVSRRGRKSTGEAERQQVSKRMKHYWAAQRK